MARDSSKNDDMTTPSGKMPMSMCDDKTRCPSGMDKDGNKSGR